MMLKRQVLQSFKSLHKTRKTIFKGDTLALERARLKINEEYKKNKNIQNDKIEQMIMFANEVENELRKNVIQAIEVEPGKYKACITEETLKLDNIPYKYNSCEGN
ncbi:hypothetical protein WA026_011730 [Henosepilachna vigintioctopunctata]|uniref:Complex III assembly factor LYRM7 n=1 Tax=Henosepilachna vigintioctopunctata TaxID=420089 RepID=A0AAW1UJ02_9CUCU